LGRAIIRVGAGSVYFEAGSRTAILRAKSARPERMTS